MQEYSIRSAVLADLKALLDFEQRIIEAERPFDPTLQKGEISYYNIEALIVSHEAEVVVVEYNGKIVASGHATLKKARHYLEHDDYAYLGFMYTHPDFRGKGLNKKIVDALKEWSDAKGLHEIRLTVYNDNIAALRAYEKVGFKRHIIEMRLEK